MDSSPVLYHIREAQPPSSSSTIQPQPSNTTTYQQPGGNNSGNSSNLYLVTFLATLFLLLFVSCAIVLRSYILRRRFQVHLDQAMAAGMLLAPRAQGSKKRRFGTKPKFFDTWLVDGGDTWEEMLPISAQPVFTKRRSKEPSARQLQQQQQRQPPPAAVPAVTTSSLAIPSLSPPAIPRVASRSPSPAPPPVSVPAQASLSQMAPFTLQAWCPFNAARQRAARRAEAPPAPPSPLPEQPPLRARALQIAVLIAMPNPHRGTTKCQSNEDIDIDEDQEPDLPELVFGVTRLPYKPENEAA
ncbi:hypothetical protein BDN72DRAFT_832870 [Pluteus cervinus]|uniref:Uncharacterized protein n=1 Tax=Pluteus cervinus TaxID=181527 RepID=A0ACD3B9U2_9AGAR|nr:hypothetical protein BDN72DRAFT_832870 [Pluteus cervinus]